MSGLRAFFRFWYDFLIGDDWLVAAGVVLALALTALLVRAEAAAWWGLPPLAALVLAASLWRATRGA